jgi:hypothetical protein
MNVYKPQKCFHEEILIKPPTGGIFIWVVIVILLQDEHNVFMWLSQYGLDSIT